MEIPITSPKKAPKELSVQPYVQVSQVDDDSKLDDDAKVHNDSSADRQDLEAGSGSTDNAEKESKSPWPPGCQPVVLGTRAQLRSSLVHLLPLAISAFLITINFQRWYWFGVEGPGGLLRALDISTNSVRNLLQLAAKVYELLVIASLGALTIKVYKHQLVESRLPLGLLTGAYRVGDVPYIFGRFFWRAVGKTYGLLALLVFVNTILATLVGPSSAILLVPELDWYPLPGAFSNIQLPVFYFDSPANWTWPRVLRGPAAPLNESADLYACDTFGGWFAYWCPSGGFADLYKWLAEWESSDLQNDVVIQDPTGAVRRQLSGKEDRFGYTVAMTTVSMPPLLTLGRLLNFIKRDNMGAIHDTPRFRLNISSESTIFQPLVQSQCVPYYRSAISSDAPAYYFDGSLKCLGDSFCEDMLKSNGTRYYISPAQWNVSDDFEARVYFSAPNATETRPLLASAAIPYRNGSTVGGVLHFACSIIAHWMPATLSVSMGETDLVQSNVTDFISGIIPEIYDLDLPAGSAGPAIKIEADWLESYISPMINVTGPDGMMTATPVTAMLELLLLQDQVFLNGTNVRLLAAAGDLGSGDERQIGKGVQRARLHVQKVLTGIVTEALARVASRSASYVVRSYNDTAVVATNLGAQTSPDGTIRWAQGKMQIEEDDQRLLGPVLNTVGNVSTPQEFVNALNTLTHFTFEAERYGYGSGKVGPTLTFALSVIYAYIIIVLAYFLYTAVLSRLLRRKSDVTTITAWGDVAELLLLAWNSRSSPALSRSSVAVDKLRLRVEVGIRAEATGRTQLVTSEEGVERLRRNELYH